MFTSVWQKWYKKKTERKVTRIVNTLRKSVFEGLDRKKEEVANAQPDYNDSNWTYEILPIGEYCTYKYYKGNDMVCMYHPLWKGNYQPGSPECKLLDDIHREWDPSIMKRVLFTLLNEWCQKEKQADKMKKERLEGRIYRIKEHLEESKKVADLCGVSADTVLLIELNENLEKYLEMSATLQVARTNEGT